MIDVTVRPRGGTPIETRGRSVASIARRVFGRDVDVRLAHDTLFDPPVERWQVTRSVPVAHAHEVLGVIVAPPRRGPGRPRTVDVRVNIGLPFDLLAEIDAAAQQQGTTRSDEIRRRLVFRPQTEEEL